MDPVESTCNVRIVEQSVAVAVLQEELEDDVEV
jgi:hypothetical protein